MSPAFFIAILLVAAAIITVIPGPSRHKQCRLGYKAICPFSPISSVILLVCGGFLFLVANIH